MHLPGTPGYSKHKKPCPRHHVAAMKHGRYINRYARVSRWRCWDTTCTSQALTATPVPPHSGTGQRRYANKACSTMLGHSRHANRHGVSNCSIAGTKQAWKLMCPCCHMKALGYSRRTNRQACPATFQS